MLQLSLFLAVAGARCPPPPAGPPRFRVALYSGYHGIGESVEAAEIGAEVRFPPFLWDLKPILGYFETQEASWMAYLGLRRPVHLGGGVHWSPSASVGYYEVGDGFDLGNHLEFRLGFDVTRRYGVWELGLGTYHLSNSGTGNINPGVENLLVTLSCAL